ncbi:MAG: isoleucine--tRNA ligase [Phycisphaeraceae bacterium]|nr:isoleucine--tRNA ligase [Phycisphaeraceae bacterium]
MSEATNAGASGQKEKNAYRATLNLPQTTFPMKANLVQNEPLSLKRWEGLYERVRRTRKGAEAFVFHDGPPYANASLHLGHLMNKCLKDFVVRSQTMMGKDCPYVPGWDCHGLPIEHKVMTDQLGGEKGAKLAALPEDVRKMAIRRECQKHAEKSQKLQAGQMQRLLTLADYADPYLTMQPEYEGATLEVLADLCGQGLVYRALKAVHWSPANETALAEAELEYMEREDISVYVDFEAADAAAVYAAFGLLDEAEEEEEEEEEESRDGRDDRPSGKEEQVDLPKPGVRPLTRPSFMIWTTTPWTLPANLAVAVNPRFMYALVWIDGAVTIVAEDLVDKVVQAAKAEQHVVIAKTRGDRLLGLRYRHPFRQELPRFRAEERTVSADKVWTVVGAEYVTLEDGTGLVHTAPGHGAEDYQTGLREGLPIYCPVKEDGTYDESVPEWLKGMSVWDANKNVTQHLRDSGHLFYDHTFLHSYPHDWRGKSPVIFRATEQWFIGVDRPTKREGKSLRELALACTAEGVRFVPEWGRNRMRGMLESRPDWCISRQRAWGVPIPAFFMPDGTCFMTEASVRAVARVVREKGTDVWFQAGAEELLAYYDPSNDSEAPSGLTREMFGTLRKGQDILDVWFESGSSWNGVIRERSRRTGENENARFPVELYLEGSDQHRGWFQSSLLASLGATGKPPFRTILTHGFMVDKDGRKMSKSLGNTLEVEALLKDYGADVCRWWVASVPFEADIKVDKSFFDVAGESYRKVRNTLRFMLSNLYDFDPVKDAVPMRNMPSTSLEAWVLGAFDALSARVRQGYETFDFQAVQKGIYDFCNDTLSAVYLAAAKDRLYCDRPDSLRRRRCQTALFTMADGLSRLLAPILCHTADETYRTLHRVDGDGCVHVEEFLPSSGVRPVPEFESLLEARVAGLLAIERAKPTKEKPGGVENPLDAEVVLPDAADALKVFDSTDLADLLGVSRVSFDASAKEARVIDLRDQPRCERSWKRTADVRPRADGGVLSDRDAEAVGVA